VPEVNDRWTDVTIVQSGRATLVSGGRVTGSRVETPGEHRGGTITGGATRPVGAGDLMVIPAGVPHQYVIAAGDSLRYVTVKVLRSAGSD
jgi:mannose-6-phosphate isomerase-like protein (cupin superfamily)